MSIFDNHASPESLQSFEEQIQKQPKEEELIGFHLHSNVICIGKRDAASFCERLEYLLSPQTPVTDEYLKSQQGRPVFRWVVESFHKRDTIGSLKSLASQPKSPKPIVIIENITDIPQKDDVHDEPQLVENYLLHSWKNASNPFDDAQFGHFELLTADYTVIIVFDTNKSEEFFRMWRPSDGISLCKDFDAELEEELKNG